MPQEEITSIVNGANYTADTDGKKYAMSGHEQAKLWLLSNAGTTRELSLVNTVMGTGYSAYYPSQADQLTLEYPTELSADWWFRSPYADYYYYAMFLDVSPIGKLYVNSEYALRPAFQINLGE